MNTTTINSQQVHRWFKAQRRKEAQQDEPIELLDLTGKQRKVAPLQYHHAYSKRFYKTKGSPLHEEVADLRERKHEKGVIDTLTPFMVGSFDVPLDFHNAIMRWKCSAFTDEEHQAHQDWIDQYQLKKEQEANKPWKAMQGAGVDATTAENEYIQRYSLLLLLPLIPHTNSNIQLYQRAPTHN